MCKAEFEHHTQTWLCLCQCQSVRLVTDTMVTVPQKQCDIIKNYWWWHKRGVPLTYTYVHVYHQDRSSRQTANKITISCITLSIYSTSEDIVSYFMVIGNAKVELIWKVYDIPTSTVLISFIWRSSFCKTSDVAFDIYMFWERAEYQRLVSNKTVFDLKWCIIY